MIIIIKPGNLLLWNKCPTNKTTSKAKKKIMLLTFGLLYWTLKIFCIRFWNIKSLNYLTLIFVLYCNVRQIAAAPPPMIIIIKPDNLLLWNKSPSNQPTSKTKKKNERLKNDRGYWTMSQTDTTTPKFQRDPNCDVVLYLSLRSWQKKNFRRKPIKTIFQQKIWREKTTPSLRLPIN